MAIYGVSKIQQDFQNGGYYRVLTFHDITSGNNGGYNAYVGWDPVTGLGSFAQYLSSTSTAARTTSVTTKSNLFIIYIFAWFGLVVNLFILKSVFK